MSTTDVEFGAVKIDVEGKNVANIPATHWSKAEWLKIDVEFVEDGSTTPPFDGVELRVLQDDEITSLVVGFTVNGEQLIVSLDRDNDGELSLQVIPDDLDVPIRS